MLLQRAKHLVRLVVASVLYYSGLFELWRRVALRRRAVVLMYHRVLDDAQLARTGSHPGIVVRKQTFARHLEVLRRHFVVLAPAEFAERITGRKDFQDSSCLITFDDGWTDTLTHAWPILRANNMPAVVFLPVNYIGTRRMFWREAVTTLVGRALDELRQNPVRRAEFERALSEAQLTALLDLDDDDPRPRIAESLAQRKDLDLTIVGRLIAALSAALGVAAEDAHPDGFISWADVSTMAGGGITFGGHGAEHRLLTHITTDEARAEIETARAELARHLDVVSPMFSYPNGNWTPTVAAMVQAAGFAMAFTTKAGPVACEDAPYSLRRVNIHEAATASPALFMARVVGLF